MLKLSFSWDKLPETITWLALFLLIPGTVLGYFAELSHPGDILYPFKQSIEIVVADYQGLYNRFNAVAQINLADRRFNEANQLLIKEGKTGKLDDFAAQVQTTEVSIKKITNPVEKKNLELTFIANIDKYQTSLEQAKIINQLNNNSYAGTKTNSTGSNPASQTTNTTQNIQTQPQQPTKSQNQQQINSQNQTVQQINQTQNTLQQVQNDLQNDAIVNTQLAASALTPTSTPTPIMQQGPLPFTLGRGNPPTLPPTSVCQCYIYGFPFIDSNGDGMYDNGESYYYNNRDLTFSLYDQHGILIKKTTQNASQAPMAEWFGFNRLQYNTQYTVKIDAIPAGYTLTTPQLYTITLGNPCNTGGSLDARCGAFGDIISLDFGITLLPSPIPTVTMVPPPVPTFTFTSSFHSAIKTADGTFVIPTIQPTTTVSPTGM